MTIELQNQCWSEAEQVDFLHNNLRKVVAWLEKLWIVTALLEEMLTSALEYCVSYYMTGILWISSSSIDTPYNLNIVLKCPWYEMMGGIKKSRLDV